jgi:nitrate reductase NapD
MNIASYIVHVRPVMAGGLREQLEAMAGVEVYNCSPDGRLVITVEDTGSRPVTDTVLAVHNLPGVLSAAMVYHFCDDGLNQPGGPDETYQA